MTKKRHRHVRTISSGRVSRPLAPAIARSTVIPAAATIAALLVGCSKREAPTPDRATTAPSTSTVASASASTSASAEIAASPSPSASSSTVAAASCSASVHVLPHAVGATAPHTLDQLGNIKPMLNAPMVNGGLAVVQPNVKGPSGNVTEAAVSTNGPLPNAQVHQVVHTRFSALRSCYVKGLNQDPTIHGVVSTSFVVGATGDVQTVTTSSSLGSAAVEKCVASVFRALHFPAADGPTSVVYPLAFTDPNG